MVADRVGGLPSGRVSVMSSCQALSLHVMCKNSSGGRPPAFSERTAATLRTLAPSVNGRCTIVSWTSCEAQRAGKTHQTTQGHASAEMALSITLSRTCLSCAKIASSASSRDSLRLNLNMDSHVGCGIEAKGRCRGHYGWGDGRVISSVRKLSTGDGYREAQHRSGPVCSPGRA